jgi:hypothetical protein
MATLPNVDLDRRMVSVGILLALEGLDMAVTVLVRRQIGNQSFRGWPQSHLVPVMLKVCDVGHARLESSDPPARSEMENRHRWCIPARKNEADTGRLIPFWPQQV